MMYRCLDLDPELREPGMGPARDLQLVGDDRAQLPLEGRIFGDHHADQGHLLRRLHAALDASGRRRAQVAGAEAHSGRDDTRGEDSEDGLSGICENDLIACIPVYACGLRTRRHLAKAPEAPASDRPKCADFTTG